MMKWNDYMRIIGQADKFERDCDSNDESILLERELGTISMFLEFPQGPKDVIKPDARFWTTWQMTPEDDISALRDVITCRDQLKASGYEGDYMMEDNLGEVEYGIEIKTAGELERMINSFNAVKLDPKAVLFVPPGLGLYQALRLVSDGIISPGKLVLSSDVKELLNGKYELVIDTTELGISRETQESI